MKLSSFMEKQFRLMDGELLLEAADKELDKKSSSDILIIGENSIMSKIKKITSVAACFLLAIAAVGAFFLIQASIETVPEDSASKDTPEEVTDIRELFQNTGITYETREEYGCIKSAYYTLAYNNVFFEWRTTIDRDIIFSIIDENGISQPYSIFDPLGENESKETPIKDNEGSFNVLLDRYATERNDCIPIFYISANFYNYDTDVTKYAIARYDMKTCEYEIIVDKLPGKVREMAIFGDTIYYMIQRNNAPDDIYSVDINGNNLKTFDNSELQYGINFISACEEYVFLADLTNHKIIRTDTDFNNIFEFGSTEECQGFIHDDYLYYYDTPIIFEEIDGQKTAKANLMKKHISGESEAEFITDEAHNLQYSDGIMYYLQYEPTYYGDRLKSTNSKIYSVDLNTNEKMLAADFSYLTGRYVVMNSVIGTSMTLEVKEYHVDSETIGYWSYYNTQNGVYEDIFQSVPNRGFYDPPYIFFYND